MDYPSFSLPSKLFGSVKLTVLGVEKDDCYYNPGTIPPPKQRIRMETGPFRVNGKAYDKLDYSFTFQDWRKGGGQLHQFQLSLRARIGDNYNVEMTPNARRKVSEELDEIFLEFKEMEQFKDSLKAADRVQRVNLYESIDSKIQDLLTKIGKYEKLREQTENSAIPIVETEMLKERLDRDIY